MGQMGRRGQKVERLEGSKGSKGSKESKGSKGSKGLCGCQTEAKAKGDDYPVRTTNDGGAAVHNRSESM